MRCRSPAGVLTYSHTQLATLALTVAFGIALGTGVIEGRRYPLHLMPVASGVARAAGPLLGISMAWLITAVVASDKGRHRTE